MKLLLYKDAKKRYVVRYNKKCYSFIDIEDCLSFALSEGEYLTDVDDFYINNHRIQYKGGYKEFCMH